MWLCHESIYQAIYQPGSLLQRPTPLAPHQRSPRCAPGEITAAPISAPSGAGPGPGRPCSPSASGLSSPGTVPQAGHWEGDLVIGKDQGSAIGTLAGQQTRMARLLPMPCRDSGTLHHALKARLADLPPVLLRPVTWDQGTEMARHLTTARPPGCGGLLLRLPLALAARLKREHERAAARLLSQGHDLSIHSPHHLLAVENELNNRPRQVLGDRTPAELFAALLAPENPLCCDVD